MAVWSNTYQLPWKYVVMCVDYVLSGFTARRLTPTYYFNAIIVNKTEISYGVIYECFQNIFSLKSAEKSEYSTWAAQTIF